jgi:hypothetical protein
MENGPGGIFRPDFFVEGQYPRNRQEAFSNQHSAISIQPFNVFFSGEVRGTA